MSKPRVRALILSAGYGTRLRPLTFALPKPLLPINGEPVAGLAIKSLISGGCEAAALNLHHLPEQIPQFFGSSYFGLPLVYSHEAEIQGTYGALYPLRNFLEQSDAVVMINGDSLCQWPIRQMVRHHLKEGADATLLLLHRRPDEALGGGIGVGADGRVVQMRDLALVDGREVVRRHVFAGLHILSPRLLSRLEPRSGDIITDLYQPLLEAGGHLATKVTKRRWHDLGTPERYHSAALDWSVPRGLGRGWSRQGHLSSLADLDPGSHITRSQIERGARIEADCEIESSLIMADTHIGAGCRIRQTIVGPGVTLPPASDVEKRMISRYDKRHELRSHESQMGDLVYTPL